MISKTCEHCSKTFQVLPYRSATARCCSRSCLWYVTRDKRDPFLLAKITGKKAANNKQIKILCKNCKAVIFVSPSRKGYTKFCSKKCYSIAAKKPRPKYKRIYVDGVRVNEHRYVMEQYLGRKLSSKEHVHHINHNHLDNRIENLEVLSISDHAKKHRRSF